MRMPNRQKAKEVISKNHDRRKAKAMVNVDKFYDWVDKHYVKDFNGEIELPVYIVDETPCAMVFYDMEEARLIVKPWYADGDIGNGSGVGKEIQL